MKRIMCLFLSILVLSGCSFVNSKTNDLPMEFKQKKRIEEKIEKLQSGNLDIKYLYKKNRLFKKPYYTLSTKPTEHAYIGKIKNDRPHGEGILMEVGHYSIGFSSPEIYIIEYAGDFKNGVPHGFGLKFSQPTEVSDVYYEYWKLESIGVRYIEYEGYFKNGLYDGKGNYYIIKDGVELSQNYGITAHYNIEKYYQENENQIDRLYDRVSNSVENKVICDLPLLESKIVYSGEFKNDEYNGKGTSYDQNGEIEYSGKWIMGKPE